MEATLGHTKRSRSTGTSMPLNEEQQWDVGERLWNAYKQCQSAWESQPAREEICGNYALTNAWPTIVTAYSGVEQAVKLLIALRKGLSVEELLKIRGDGASGRPRFQSHNLACLFMELDPEAKTKIGEGFKTFLSLYCFIPYQDVEEFLTEISEDEGYIRWRHCLVEVERQPGRNAPDALLALWRCLLIELKRTLKWGRGRCVPLSKEILKELKCLLDQAEKDEVNEQALQEVHQTGIWRYPQFDRDIQNWLGPAENHLSAYARAIHDEYNGKTGTSKGTPVAIAGVLRRWHESLVLRAREDRTALSVFARRAWGESLSWAVPAGPSIAWDNEASRFRPTPWTLEPRTATCAPPDTAIVKDDHPWRSDFRRLRKLAGQHGYSFLENQECKGGKASEQWCRIYEVRSTDPPRRTILTLWARCAEKRTYHACEGPGLADAPDDFRGWLLTAQYDSRRRDGSAHC